MSAKKLQLLPELVNFFLREVQQGTLSDATKLSQHFNFQGSIRDLIMCTNKHGDTPFLMAARHGHCRLLQTLFEEYGVPLEHTNTDGKTALHEAAQNGHTSCANYLIQAGACVDCLKRADWSVGQYSILKRMSEVHMLSLVHTLEYVCSENTSTMVNIPL